MSRDARLDVLTQVYVAERADDTQAASGMFALLTASTALLSLIGFVLVNAETSDLPGWAVALAPLPPLPFMAFAVLVSHISNVRGRVVDLYEEQIARLLGTEGTALPFPVGHRVLNEIWQGVYGRMLIATAYVALLGMYVGVLFQSFRYARDTDFALALAVLILCAVALAMFSVMLALALNPRRPIHRAIENIRRETKRNDDDD